MQRRQHAESPSIKGIKRKKRLLKTELVFDEKSRSDFVQNSQQRHTQRQAHAKRVADKKRREAVRAFKAQTAQSIRDRYKEAVTYRNGSIAAVSRSQLCPETEETDASEPEVDPKQPVVNAAPEIKTVVSDFYGEREQPVTISVTLMDSTAFSSSLTAAALGFWGAQESHDANKGAATSETNRKTSDGNVAKQPSAHVQASGKSHSKKARAKRNRHHFDKTSTKRTKKTGGRKP